MRAPVSRVCVGRSPRDDDVLTDVALIRLYRVASDAARECVCVYVCVCVCVRVSIYMYICICIYSQSGCVGRRPRAEAHLLQHRDETSPL